MGRVSKIAIERTRRPGMEGGGVLLGVADATQNAVGQRTHLPVCLACHRLGEMNALRRRSLRIQFPQGLISGEARRVHMALSLADPFPLLPLLSLLTCQGLRTIYMQRAASQECESVQLDRWFPRLLGKWSFAYYAVLLQFGYFLLR